MHACVFSAYPDLKTLCNELDSVKHKLPQIGVVLGIPGYKMNEFKKGDDPLSVVLSYWLYCSSGGAVSWKSIVNVLKSAFVGEATLAEKIRAKYCEQQQIVEGKGQIFSKSMRHSAVGLEMFVLGICTKLMPLYFMSTIFKKEQ